MYHLFLAGGGAPQAEESEAGVSDVGSESEETSSAGQPEPVRHFLHSDA